MQDLKRCMTIAVASILLVTGASEIRAQDITVSLNDGLGLAKTRARIKGVEVDVMAFEVSDKCFPPCLIMAVRRPTDWDEKEKILIFLVRVVDDGGFEPAVVIPQQLMEYPVKTPWTA